MIGLIVNLVINSLVLALVIGMTGSDESRYGFAWVWIRCLFLAAFLALWSFLATLAIAHLAPDTPYLFYAVLVSELLIRLGGLMVLFHLTLGEAVLFSILASIVSMGIGRGLSFALSKLPLFGAGLLRI